MQVLESKAQEWKRNPPAIVQLRIPETIGPNNENHARVQ